MIINWTVISHSEIATQNNISILILSQKFEIYTQTQELTPAAKNKNKPISKKEMSHF